jgi:hypothetical protein
MFVSERPVTDAVLPVVLVPSLSLLFRDFPFHATPVAATLSAVLTVSAPSLQLHGHHNLNSKAVYAF